MIKKIFKKSIPMLLCVSILAGQSWAGIDTVAATTVNFPTVSFETGESTPYYVGEGGATTSIVSNVITSYSIHYTKLYETWVAHIQLPYRLWFAGYSRYRVSVLQDIHPEYPKYARRSIEYFVRHRQNPSTWSGTKPLYRSRNSENRPARRYKHCVYWW